ncbi:MAG: hypothetical protein JEY97_06360 [Bacteroidales bacterium]|nr:hypothetical protein [Bacteroidales bacterium]
MKKSLKIFSKFLLAGMLIFVSFSTSAQELSVVESSSVNIEDFPEYVIITSQNTKLLGGIGISIDSKKSSYKKQLQELENILQNGKKLKVRNQTDLLNSMSKLGFEYLNAYVATATTSTDQDGISFGDNTYRVNMVFRKKESLRN